MAERLWAPWRLEYLESDHEESECVFCVAAERGLTPESLLLHRGNRALVILNKYPYAPGHLMVAPTRHCGSLHELTSEEAAEIHELLVNALEALERASAPHGFNVGWNLGRPAGAGIVDHVHQHIVPRWSGDTNFMPVLADTRVMPEHLLATREKLLEAWEPREQ